MKLYNVWNLIALIVSIEYYKNIVDLVDGVEIIRINYRYLSSNNSQMLCILLFQIGISNYFKDSELSTQKGAKSGGRVAFGVTVFDHGRLIGVTFSTCWVHYFRISTPKLSWKIAWSSEFVL